MPRFAPTNRLASCYSRLSSFLQRPFLFAVLLGGIPLVATPANGQIFDPPINYYNSATGTGSTLQSQLHNIIDNHTIRSYGDARFLLQITDADPDQPGHMILAYSNESLNVSIINPNGSIPGWDFAATWNREHTWPTSRGVETSGADYSDLHQLRPSDTGVNADRGNLNFGGAFGSNGGNFGTLNDGNGTVWYPGDEEAGRIARQQFYVDVRYDGSDSATIDLELSNNNPGGNRLGDLARLIEWHFAAPVDEFEQRRNDIIFDDFQGNRNPFIDRPEFVWSVFVDQSNDSRIEFAGSTTDGNGQSTLEINERAIFGNPAPITTEVTLNKTGLDGTYFWVETSGDVTSSLSSGLNAFRSNQTDSMTFTIQIPTPGFGVGVRTGTITVDNLDITTQGGSGRGANDGDDTLIASFTALDHAGPSFSGDSGVNSLELELGDFFVGSQFTPTAEINLFNRASIVGSALTANLDLDAILESDAFDKFDVTGDLFSNLAPTGSRTFSFVGTSDELGTFSASYEFQVSDEDIEGEQASTLTMTLNFNVVGQRGDFNGSGNIDNADIDFFNEQLGQTINAESELRELDLNDDGMITLDDHDLHVTTLTETLSGIQGTLIGDLNLDGTVDVLNDAFIMISNLGSNGLVGFADGDLNADGIVDVLGDAFRLIGNLGQAVNN